MAWKETIDLTQLQKQERETIVIDGHKILLIWHKEKAYAVQAQCPHFKLPLTKGKINDECAIICPFHKSEFDLVTGKVNCWSAWPPAIGRLLGKVVKENPLKVYAICIKNDKILVDIN